MLVPIVFPIVLTILIAQAPATPPSSATPQPPVPPVQPTEEKPWPSEGVFRFADVTPPRLIKDAKPSYTGDAMRAQIKGVVVLEAIVERDGKVGEVRVKQSLDREYGLDEEAVKAVKRWRFVPGMKDGRPARAH
jgi:protein TonB